MEDRSKLEIGVFITMALLMSGAYFIGVDDDAYYCESKDIVAICEKLSSGTGSRCYFAETYKVCAEGWQKIEQEIVLEPAQNFEVFANNELYSCEISNGRVNSYSMCVSPTQRSAYLGELV